jgi:hypothetical protein
MMDCRKQLNAISPFFCRADEKRYESGVYYWGVLDRKQHYQKLADLTSGKTGDLVAVLPEQAAFAIDPNDAGRFEEWYQPGFDTKAWKAVPTTKPFYLNGLMDAEGYTYMGAMWYRLEVDVPSKFRGRPISLYALAVETEAWVWVNGQYIAYRPYIEAYTRPIEVDMDVTSAVKPGKNVFVLRVQTGLNRASAADGILSRLFLYSPKPAAAK